MSGKHYVVDENKSMVEGMSKAEIETKESYIFDQFNYILGIIDAIKIKATIKHVYLENGISYLDMSGINANAVIAFKLKTIIYKYIQTTTYVIISNETSIAGEPRLSNTEIRLQEVAGDKWSIERNYNTINSSGEYNHKTYYYDNNTPVTFYTLAGIS